MPPMQRIIFGSLVRKKFKSKVGGQAQKRKETLTYLASDYPESFEEFIKDLAVSFMEIYQKKKKTIIVYGEKAMPEKQKKEIISDLNKIGFSVITEEKKKRPRIKK